MLDPGTESIVNALISPAILAAGLGYLAQRYFEKQEETLKAISGALEEIKVKLAVAESRSLLIEEIREDLQKLRDEHIQTKGKVEAAWRFIDGENTWRPTKKSP